MIKYFLVLLSLSLAAVGCATSQYGTNAPEDVEVAKARQDIENHRLVDRWVSMDEADATVRNVADSLWPYAEEVCARIGEAKQCGNWWVTTEDSDDVNAYATGQNKIAISRGLMRIARNDDSVAWVVAHEMGHHIANHLNEQRANATLGYLLGGTLMAAAGGGYATSDDIDNAGQLGAYFGSRPFSRGQENEADYIAAFIMTRAGYDMYEAEDLMKQMHAMSLAEGGAISDRAGFNATHPAGPERLARWRNLVDEARGELVTRKEAKRRAQEASSASSIKTGS